MNQGVLIRDATQGRENIKPSETFTFSDNIDMRGRRGLVYLPTGSTSWNDELQLWREDGEDRRIALFP